MIDSELASKMSRLDPLGRDFAEIVKQQKAKHEQETIDYKKKMHRFSEQEHEKVIMTKNKAMALIKKQLAGEEIQQPKETYDLTVRDTRQLTDLMTNLSPKSEMSRNIANDLDDNLQKLAQHTNSYQSLIKEGRQKLNKFDQSAKKIGIEIPERKIEKFTRKNTFKQLSLIDDAPKVKQEGIGYEKG